MSNSLIEGKTWYWRQGVKKAPMHGDVIRTTELYLPVKDENLAKSIIDELNQQGIVADSKRTRSPYDVVPQGSLIIFAGMSQEVSLTSEQENMKKLKSYISDNGGKIDTTPRTYSAIRIFMQNLFGRK